MEGSYWNGEEGKRLQLEAEVERGKQDEALLGGRGVVQVYFTVSHYRCADVHYGVCSAYQPFTNSIEKHVEPTRLPSRYFPLL